MKTVLRLPVREPSQAGDARRQVARWAEALGLDEECRARLALVVTEAAGNLNKHATDGGELLVRALARGRVPGIEVLVLDGGPGISQLTRALGDGYSTAGSPGTGLGAISRLADEFAIHSLPGRGTALLARVWAGPAPSTPPASLDVGVVNLPKPGEEMNGDGWAAVLAPRRSVVLVVDGLGHGPDAATAAHEAVRAFREGSDAPPTEIIQRIHGALRSTRGAAVAVAVVDPDERLLRFAGVGNISGAIFAGGGSRSLVSHNGIVGHQMLKVQEFSYPWPTGATLVLHSDGIATRWDLADYPGLLGRDPALIAGVLFRDHVRGRDDATVLVARDSAVPA